MLSLSFLFVSPATFNCLAVLLRLNQLIVEPFLEDVCGLFWDFKGEVIRTTLFPVEFRVINWHEHW